MVTAKKEKGKEKEKEAPKTPNAAKATVHTAGRGLPKFRQGLVVSNKMDKTVVVAVSRQVKHGQYGKYVRKTSKYFAHDEKNECNVGDLVKIVETRPLSRMKRWKIREIVEKAE